MDCMAFIPTMLLCARSQDLNVSDSVWSACRIPYSLRAGIRISNARAEEGRVIDASNGGAADGHPASLTHLAVRLDRTHSYQCTICNHSTLSARPDHSHYLTLLTELVLARS